MNDYIPLAEASKRLPGRNGGKVHVDSLRRWIINGLRGVKLKANRVGGLWMTTHQWIDEFIQATTARSLGGATPALPERNEAHELAVARLAARYGLHVGKKPQMPLTGMQQSPDTPGAVPKLLRRRLSPRAKRSDHLGEADRSRPLPTSDPRQDTPESAHTGSRSD